MSVKINMIKIRSSQIYSIGYLEEEQELYVEFTNKTTYMYANVPKDVWNEFQRSDSKGSYFHSNIKTKYKYVKI